MAYSVCAWDPLNPGTAIWKTISKDCSEIGEGWICSSGECTNKPEYEFNPIILLIPLAIGSFAVAKYKEWI